MSFFFCWMDIFAWLIFQGAVYLTSQLPPPAKTGALFRREQKRGRLKGISEAPAAPCDITRADFSSLWALSTRSVKSRASRRNKGWRNVGKHWSLLILQWPYKKCFVLFWGFSWFCSICFFFCFVFSRRMWLSCRLNVGLLLCWHQPSSTYKPDWSRPTSARIYFRSHNCTRVGTLSFIKNKTLHLKHKGDSEGPGGKIHHGIVIITYRKKITGFESLP